MVTDVSRIQRRERGRSFQSRRGALPFSHAEPPAAESNGGCCSAVAGSRVGEMSPHLFIPAKLPHVRQDQSDSFAVINPPLQSISSHHALWSPRDDHRSVGRCPKSYGRIPKKIGRGGR